MIGGVTLFAIFAASYFWFPKMFGRMMSESLGKLHFWSTFAPFYAVFVAMHFFGWAGAPRRYYAFGSFQFLSGYEGLAVFISLCAFVLGAGQLVFAFNFLWSMFKGKRAESNPWEATTLEWTTPSPPPHGNWGEREPEVHRWPYDYSLAGAPEDFTPQTVPPDRVPAGA
jgi:cytochrome c oxidase subunit 1